MAKDQALFLAKQSLYENLETLQTSLMRCVEEGMIDLDDDYYNEVLGLIQDSETLKTWGELAEAVARGKALETDIAAWLSRHGKTTVSLSWPTNLPK